MTLDDMLEVCEKWVRVTIIDKPGVQIPPTFLMETIDELKVISMPWENARQRSIVLKLMKFMMKYKSVISYSVISENWKASESFDPKKQSGLMPSQREDKKEVIMIIAVDKLHKKSVEFDIMRNKDAVVIDLIKNHNLIKTIGGDLTTLLED